MMYLQSPFPYHILSLISFSRLSLQSSQMTRPNIASPCACGNDSEDCWTFFLPWKCFHTWYIWTCYCTHAMTLMSYFWKLEARHIEWQNQYNAWRHWLELFLLSTSFLPLNAFPSRHWRHTDCNHAEASFGNDTINHASLPTLSTLYYKWQVIIK
jgi:hypothetical protein